MGIVERILNPVKRHQYRPDPPEVLPSGELYARYEVSAPKDLDGYQEFDNLKDARWLVKEWKKKVHNLRLINVRDMTYQLPQRGYLLVEQWERNDEGKWRKGHESYSYH